MKCVSLFPLTQALANFKGRITGSQVLDLRGEVKASGADDEDLHCGTGTGLDPPEGCAEGTNPPQSAGRKASTVVEGERWKCDRPCPRSGTPRGSYVGSKPAARPRGHKEAEEIKFRPPSFK